MDRGNITTANGRRELPTITNYSDARVTWVDNHPDQEEDQDLDQNERRVVVLENGNNQSSDSKTFTSRDPTTMLVDEFKDDLDVPSGNNTQVLDEPVEYFLLDDSPMARFARSVKWAYKKLPVGGGGAVLVLSELESMASRQQREIAQQRRLLEQREARLAVLRGAQEPAQQERLARLRHRLDQQQSKLNRLRLLRSQTDQSRANNATLTSDLDCIRALFNEKEKELSLAVAKVEELTRQLEELRGRHNGNAAGSGVSGQVPSTASAELEKLRRELMFRNKMNEQQNQVVSQQRLVLAQRQAEMVSIDARIAQLQGRLQRKRALNQRLLTQQQIANNRHQITSASTITTSSTSTTMTPCLTDQLNKHQDFTSSTTNNNNNNNNTTTNNNNNNNNNKLRPAGNVAAIEPYSHIPNNDNNDNNFNINKNDPKYQTLPYNTKFTVNLKPIDDDVNKNNSNKIQHSQSASQIGQRATLQQLEQQIAHSQSQSHIQGQSQLLGINQPSVQPQQLPPQQQPQHTSPQTFPTQSGNFIVHSTNNNSNNNNNNNIITTTAGSNINVNSVNNNNLINNQSSNIENQNQGPNRVTQPQISSHVKPGPTISASINQDKSSITQSHNHRNLQTHAKPVSSVAPSFPVKSPIYQTSSTKIHPVMPQTLSLIGRGHPGPQQMQSYAERSNIQNSNSQAQTQTQLQQHPVTTGVEATTVTTTTYPRHNFTQGHNVTNYKNPLNNFPQASLSNLGNANFPGYPAPLSYNQTTNVNTSSATTASDAVVNDINRLKFDNNNKKLGINVSEEQIRYELGQNKHENGSIQQQQQQQQLQMTHQYNKHEGHDNLINRTTKYEHNSQYKHDSQHKYEPASNFQQFKQQQELNKYPEVPMTKEHTTTTAAATTTTTTHKYEPSVPVKHDHTTKLEPPAKPDKLYEYERNKASVGVGVGGGAVVTESDRKTVNFIESKSEDKMKPALPPKPIKPNPPPRLNSQDKPEVVDTIVPEGVKSPVLLSRSDKEEEIPPIPTSEPPPDSPNEVPVIGNHQIIKARPLTLKKVLLSEQPRLRYSKSNVHVSINRRIEMPPAFLFPETQISPDLMQTEQQQQSLVSSDVIDHSTLKIPSAIDDEVPCNEKLEDSDIVEALNVINIEDKLKKDAAAQERKPEVDTDSNAKTEVIRRKKGNLKSTTGKANLSRRVSFDPLALLLDASLEGELELVKKTAKEVPNPSSANDEGITALHNAICAGHLDIVKFLVEFGCDVNAQDSDGWTPLHCAASCNNLAMVRFLVEHGACIFATTLSDHETAAEKCEEDEEGFDGCSEYLYSVQEKLGIMNNGQVYAVFEYDAQHNDELSLKNGDQLEIIRKGDDNEREWWWSRLGHREGYVPRNLLGLFPRVLPNKPE